MTILGSGAHDLAMKRLPRTPTQFGLFATRALLPLAFVVVGAVLMAFGDAASYRDVTFAVGLVLAGIGVMVWMLNWMFRMSVDSNLDREREEMAREYFDQHGRWPDEARAAGADTAGRPARATAPEGER